VIRLGLRNPRKKERKKELGTCPDDGAARAQAPGCQRSISISVGPFEEEEEGTGIASDIVKVEGEDPVTPCDYPRSVDTRTPRDRNDSPILV